jgi:hypothetical protein
MKHLAIILGVVLFPVLTAHLLLLAGPRFEIASWRSS